MSLLLVLLRGSGGISMSLTYPNSQLAHALFKWKHGYYHIRPEDLHIVEVPCSRTLKRHLGVFNPYVRFYSYNPERLTLPQVKALCRKALREHCPLPQKRDHYAINENIPSEANGLPSWHGYSGGF